MLKTGHNNSRDKLAIIAISLKQQYSDKRASKMTANLNTNLNFSQQECPVTLEFDISNSTRFPKSAIPTWIAVSVISGVMAVPTFWINLLVIWTILENESLRSLNYNLILAILALTDLLVGLVVNPLFIAFNICVTLGCASDCDLTTTYLVVVVLCTGWSIGTLMIASVERYLAIEYPLYYNTKVSTRNLLAAVAVTWLLAVITLLFRLMFDDSYKTKQISRVLYLGISLSVVLYCTSKVSKTAHRQMKSINAQQIALQGASTTADRIKEYKRTFALASIVLISIIFYCPFIIIKVILLANGKEWNSELKYVMPSISMVFVHLQSVVNPIVYSIRLSYIRVGVVKKLFCRS
ncbi:adenosine receptor A2b-like [Actinia tenebrosa]|uniref:Adenosine receptor A2b-like n=1 Tax=Actinia tenebrosa TaxID=6105 RepID=A0A6P8IJN3_ACTTE|nr:adenosine receptor A2b-like [Actinia tenebrosa]